MHWMDTSKFLPDRPREQESLIQYSHVTWPQLEIAQAAFFFFCQQYAANSFYKVQAQLQIQVQVAFSPRAKPSSQNNSHRLSACSLNKNPAEPMVIVVLDK